MKRLLLLIIVSVFSVSAILSQADLSISKSVTPPNPNAGSNVVFSITVSNGSANLAEGVWVNEQIPDGYSYVSHSGDGTYEPAEGKWDIGTLAASTSATLNITATVHATGNYENAVTVNSNWDDNGGNNSASILVTPIATTVSVQSASNAAEPSTNGQFKVVLSAAVASNVTVNLNYSGTATFGIDYSAPASVVISAGSTESIVNITIENDDIVEGTETIVLGISSTNNSDVTVDSNSASINITDDDTATINLSGFTVSETNSNVNHNFVATLSKASKNDVVFSFSTTDGTAKAGSDFVAVTPKEYTINAGSTSINIPVTIIGDTKPEPSETFTGAISLVNVYGQAITGETLSATATINDDDAADLSLSGFTATETNADETHYFIATLSHIAQENVVVSFTTTEGSAKAGTDFVAQSGTTHTIAAGNTSVQIPVVIVGDNVAEGIETFTGTIAINNANGQTINLTTATATATIEDNDAAEFSINDITVNESAGTANFTVTLNAAVQGGASVNYASANGTAIEPDDYNSANGTLNFTGTAGETKTIAVTINNDDIAEPTEVFYVDLSSATGNGVSITKARGIGTIEDNDTAGFSINDITVNESAGTANFTVTLNAAVQGGASVSYTTTNGTAVAPGDYISDSEILNFTGTAGETKTIAVTINNDDIAEPTEVFYVDLSGPTGNGVSITKARGIGTIEDNDVAGFSINDITVNESIGTATFTVTLNAAVQGGASVTYATANGTAIEPGDYTSASGILNFTGTAGETKSIAVPINNDDIAEPTEVFYVDLSSATGNGVSITKSRGIGNINDNDAVVISLAGFSVTETNESQSKNFVATSNRTSQHDIEILFSTSDGTAIAGSDYQTQSNVKYIIAAGQLSVNIPVVILGDEVSESEESFTGTITLENANGQQVTINPATATATIIDDDFTNLAITKTIGGTSPYYVGSNVTFTITVQNTGTRNAFNVKVEDILLSGFEFVSATPSIGTWESPNWSIGTLNSGASVTLQLVAKINASGIYSNTASVTSSTTDTNNTDNTAVITIIPTPRADLEIEKTVNKLSPVIGEDVVFTLKVKNSGPSNATGVIVNDMLPDGYTFKSYSGDGTYDSATGIWTINNLANGIERTLNITATVKLGTNYTNTASVSANENDPVPGNNMDSVTPGTTNSAPVAVNDSYTTPEDTPLNVLAASGLLSNDYDVDGNTITLVNFTVNGTTYNVGQTASISQGTILVNANGSLVFTPILNFNGTLPVISYTISDGTLTATASVNIVVTPVNDAPVAVADSYTTLEDTQLNVATDNGLLKNDYDVDGDNISVVSFTINSTNFNAGQTANFTQGSITILANGSFVFMPALNYNGNLSGITYTISDGVLTHSNPVAITVSAVNDPPVANPDYLYTAESTGTIINVLSNDNDTADGAFGGLNPNSLKITKQPVNGTMIVLANKTISYTPHTGFFGQDEAEYEICDVGHPLPALCSTGKIYIDVTRLSPQAVNDVAQTNEDTAVDINVLANDIDTDINPATLAIVTKPTNGTATYLGNGIVKYMPNLNYNGNDFFTYTVRDMTNLISNVARVDITIHPVPDPPVSVNGWYSTPENVQVVIPIHQLVSDPDNDIDFSTIVIAEAPLNGSISLGVNPGELIYTPNFGYAGNDSFKYNVADATGLRSNTSTISLQVSDQAPIANDDAITINEDEPIVISVLANDTDPQNNIEPSSVVIVTPPSNGTATVNTVNGTVNYTPNLDYNGADWFVYRVCDVTHYCDEAKVNITILPVNDAPVAVDDYRTLAEDNSVLIDVLANDYDVDNINDDLVISIVTQPLHGKVQVVTNPDGIVYTPDLNYFGVDNFLYKIADPDGFSSEATVYLTITPVNDPPEPANDHFGPIGEAGMVLNILANDTDPENNINPASVTIVIAAQHGTTTVNLNGTVFYKPNPAYFGNDGLTYSVCDTDGACAQAQVTLWIVAGNGPPVANDDFIELNEDTPTQFNPLVNDTDPNNNIWAPSLIFFGEQLVDAIKITNGTITIINKNDGDYLYTPNADFYGSDQVQYQICDSGDPALCATATVYFIIKPVNDAPKVLPDVIHTFDMSVASINVLDNDFEVEGEPMIASLVTTSPSAYGEFKLAADGIFEYTSYPGSYCKTDVITYQVCDPWNACAETQILVHIMPLDTDGDGIPDFIETTWRDTNNDGTPDYLSSDSDGDGIPDSVESGIIDACMDDTLRDTDGDGTPDYRDLDADGDGVPDTVEGTGDCDGDGIPNYIDKFDDCGDRMNIPSTFSPNGDGINDYWVIQGVVDYPTNELSVFNRWGSLVYHRKSYDNTWDGKASTNVMGAEELPEGTYFYILVLDAKKTLKGSVYIKR